MDYTSLFKGAEGKKSRVGIIGATRGYGYTLLAQIPKVELMELRLISSRHTDECMEVLTGLGYKEENIVVCTDKDQVKNAPKDAVCLLYTSRCV